MCGGGRNGVRNVCNTPLYEKRIKKHQNKPMETTLAKARLCGPQMASKYFQTLCIFVVLEMKQAQSESLSNLSDFLKN